MSNFLYPATVESNNEGGFIAKFRDVPEAITEAWDLEELKNTARAALISAIDFYPRLEHFVLGGVSYERHSSPRVSSDPRV